jgi:hypothetical protein
MSAQIVIHCREREAYFAARGDWSRRLTDARSFGAAAEAEAFCREQKLRDVEIVVLRTDRPPMRIPVRFSENDSKRTTPLT